MKKTINKEVLKNWIKHTDSQNRVWEESEMWKQRKLETEAQDRRTDKRTDKRRKEDPPAPGNRECVTGYWNKKLMELKEKDSTRWGHSGYKELYPEEFADKQTDKLQHAKHAKKRHRESSDSEDVSRNDFRPKPARKDTEDEKSKRHKKSKQKDEPPLVHKSRGKSPKIRGKSLGFVKKSDKNKDPEKSSKNMEEPPYQRDKSPKNKCSSRTRTKSVSSDSEQSDLDSKRKKRRKASPEKGQSPQLKSPNKLGKTRRKVESPTDEQGRSSSRAAEIREQIEKLEHSVDEKKFKRSSINIDKSEENFGPALPVEMKSPSADGLDSGSDVKQEKPKKHKKKKKHHHDADTDEEPLIEEKVDKKAKHKDSSDKSKQRPKAEESEFSLVKKSKKHHKSEGSYLNDGEGEEVLKRKKSNKAKKSDKCHDSSDTKSRTHSTKSEDKISRKNGKHDASVENEAEEMPSRETVRGSKKHKKSKQSSDSPKKSENDRKQEELGDEEESDRSSKNKGGDSNNGYKRLKFKKGVNPQRRRSPSPTISTSLNISSALDDIKDPMEDFPKSGTDNESISEGEISPSKEKKPQKKTKKSKKKKDKKKRKDKKSSKSAKGDKEPKYSLEVSDNFGLCDSVLAFDEIGDIELE